jgi:hypothetical protein
VTSAEWWEIGGRDEALGLGGGCWRVLNYAPYGSPPQGRGRNICDPLDGKQRGGRRGFTFFRLSSEIEMRGLS